MTEQITNYVRRLWSWLWSRGSPTQYTETDIRTHRSIARTQRYVGTLALLLAVGYAFTKPAGSSEQVDVIMLGGLIAVVMYFTARGLDIAALKWEVHELREQENRGTQNE